MNLELIILEGPQAGRRLSLGSEPVTFGRSVEAAFSFPQDNFMSGMHLTAQMTPDGLMLVDQRSTNGSFLNDQRITEALAAPNDIIRVGSLTMQVVETQSSPTMPVLSSPLRSLPAEVESAGMKPRLQNEPVLAILRQAGAPLFCLLDAAAAEMIPSLLAVAQERKECLYDGDSAVMLARWAPYLIQFSPESALLEVLVDKGWGKGWASFFTSNASFEELRKHFRKFLMVQLEEGREVYFRFYDPRVLRDFLPTANSRELTTFFGPVVEWTVEAESKAAVIKIQNGSGGLNCRIISLADIPLTTQSKRIPTS
jgi:pSer/pThr/pTyr-binding forkhead associated (FHA) protein